MTAAALITIAIGLIAAWLLYHHDRQQARAALREPEYLDELTISHDHNHGAT